VIKYSWVAVILLTLTSAGLILSVGYWSGLINPSFLDFEILVTPSSREMYSDEFPFSISFKITLRSINGFDNLVEMSTENVPSGLTAYFEWPYPGTSTLTVTCPADGEISFFLWLIPEEQCSLEAGIYTVTIHGISGSLSRSKNVTLHILEESQDTRLEKLVIVSVYAVKEDSQWNVTMKVKNTGATNATIEYVHVNGKPGNEFNPAIEEDASGVTIPGGSEANIHIYIPTSLFEQLTTVEIKLHTYASLDYMQIITLP